MPFGATDAPEMCYLRIKRSYGMEEVIGSIPIRSTNKPQQINSLAMTPFSIIFGLGAE
jgi:hypothetical protein